MEKKTKENKNLMEQEQDGFSEKLIKAGLVAVDQLEEMRIKAKDKKLTLARYLVESAVLPKAKVYEILAETYGVPYVDLSSVQIDSKMFQLIPSELAHRYRVIPLFKIGDTINIAMENPRDIRAIDHLSHKLNATLDVCLTTPEDIDMYLNKDYGVGDSMSKLLQSLNEEKSRDGLAHVHTAAEAGDESPIIRFVDLLLRHAFEVGASDIHVEPEENHLRVRFRIDGVLHESWTPPQAMVSGIVSRLKIIAGMNIAETRLPQDGRIRFELDGQQINARVSSLPTVHGENLVLRILKQNEVVMNLSHLGVNEEMKRLFERLIKRPYGMILETGPTGSGKTTTLYTALSMLNSVERNIMTIEDPVEYKLPYLRQIPVNVKTGLTFANALRAVLRQDPDVVMVGEIRDEETASIAIQASLTGHLVLSTLHTNNAASAVTRLVDMGIEPFLVSSSVIGVIAQRLVRTICQKCKEETAPDRKLLEVLRWPEMKNVYRGKGCRHCQNTGYKGRIGIFEFLDMTESIQKKILQNANAAEIEKAAREVGFKDMREDALEKIKGGWTTLEEVIKVAAQR